MLVLLLLDLLRGAAFDDFNLLILAGKMLHDDGKLELEVIRHECAPSLAILPLAYLEAGLISQQIVLQEILLWVIGDVFNYHLVSLLQALPVEFRILGVVIVFHKLHKVDQPDLIEIHEQLDDAVVPCADLALGLGLDKLRAANFVEAIVVVGDVLELGDVPG